jgi:hypothetical protein
MAEVAQQVQREERHPLRWKEMMGRGEMKFPGCAWAGWALAARGRESTGGAGSARPPEIERE